jgi:hypothetical protein
MHFVEKAAVNNGGWEKKADFIYTNGCNKISKVFIDDYHSFPF